MTLSLDHTQRLNLIALLDVLECPRREAWAVCKLQDLLDLSEAERQQLGYHKEVVDGREGYRWDATKSIDRRQYDLGDDDVERISQALDKMPSYMLGRDRWFRSLQAQLPEPPSNNGHMNG